MKRLTFIAAVMALLWLAGCIPTSLHPLYTEKDLVYEEALVGRWVEEGTTDTVFFVRDGARNYTMTMTEDSVRLEFSAHLFKIDDNLFLDLSPESDNLKLPGFLKEHLAPMHSFYRVEQIEPTFKLSGLSEDWLRDYLEANPEVIGHMATDYHVILTAPTADLQAFISKHVDTEGAFSEETEFRKVGE
ncbi:MAG: hypothetical protein ABII79_01045 [bacterium]